MASGGENQGRIGADFQNVAGHRGVNGCKPEQTCVNRVNFFLTPKND
jgi:hypothetical protein